MDTYRRLNARVVWPLALFLSVFELYTVGFGILSPFAQRATMMVCAALLTFLIHPTADWVNRPELDKFKRLLAATWDYLLIVIALYACLYLIVNEDAIADRSGAETSLDLFIAAIGPLVVLDMVRRIAGIPLLLVSIGVIVYAYLGDIVLVVIGLLGTIELIRRFVGGRAAAGLALLIIFSVLIPEVRNWLDPATFPFQGESHQRMASYLWLTSEGTFGTITAIMTEFIFIFILFSAILESTGAGQILMNLAIALTGRFRGGPAQSAVVASSMFGMVSGSTMANVVSTGTFTIPLMIRTGFSRTMAGAIEAVASCGGQIMPPIMGASVFIMAEITGVPYVKLMLYALIPALLYFASLSTSIYFEASRIGLGAMDPAEIPNGWEQVRQGGYLLIPVFILLASIISGETPGRAGFKAVVSLMLMVDLVRSLKWIRFNWDWQGVMFVGGILLGMLFLAYGPITLPQSLANTLTLPILGDIGWTRLLLFALGILFATVPALRGLPIVIFLALATARWQFPPELLWLGQIPFIGMLLPLTLVGLIIYLIALPVFTNTEALDPRQSARDFGRSVLVGFEKGAKNSLSLIAATSAIGMIVGLLVLAALGVRISILVTEVATISLLLALFLVMIASLIMGMGLPTIAAYLLLVIIVAPALNDLGTSIVAAHMFIFYFGVISSITPPVALAAYGASGISGANAMRTGVVACRLAITAFIAPFLFTYYPELLLLEGSAWDVAYRLGVCLTGIIFVSMATMGYGLAPLGLISRLILYLAALLLFVDNTALHALGAIIGVVHIFRQRSSSPSAN